MNHIAELRDMGEFSQATESFAKEKDKLIELKQILDERLLSIKQQIEGLLAADGPQLDKEEAEDVRGRIHRAETAKSYIIRKMSKVDSVLTRLNREGGWLMWASNYKESCWIATKVQPSEWLIREISEYEDEAREISFSLPITADQWSRLPPSVQKYES